RPSSANNVKFLGTTRLKSGPAPQKSATPFLRKSLEVDETFDIPGANGNNSPARVKAAHVPFVSGNPIAGGSFSGFEGLTEFEQAYLVFPGIDGVNGELEPPDQGLAVGNGFVVEAINDAIAAWDTSGDFLAAEALNPFFGQAPEATIDPATGAIVSFGPFLTDPRVLYDASTGRFFVSVGEIDTDPATGNFGSAAHLLIAVSVDANPLDGFNIFSLDITNDGDARFGACPCFGDEPLVGFDANGFYISTNAFSISALTFRGAQLYAISKTALETIPIPATVAQHFGNLNQAEGPGHSIQPAFVPPSGAFASDLGGTEYLVSSLDFTHTLDNRLTVWAMTNTSSLNTTPALTLVNVVIDTETYGPPPDTEQMAGPTPLLDLIASALGVKNHEELLSDGDDRLQQVTFANGMLWTSVPTVVQTAQGPVRAGAAWFILTPSVGDAQVNATVSNQGYVAINSPKQDGVLYPAVGVNALGKAVIAFSIAGDDFFPSAAYAPLDAVNGAGPVVISFNGVAPDDGFSAYRPFGPDVRGARWGDYSAAVSDEAGDLWMGAEVIPTEQAPFVPFANWGTFITNITP
ncbi:MAG TPA: hypothetical protein VKU44_00525, partial [Terriglobia bacterium]|nr:hypothetical protein [Terriglobia bacterium]